MTGWYYRDDSGGAVGPVDLTELAHLIRANKVPEDVFVSRRVSGWETADSVQEVLDTGAIDRERILREYIAYGEAPLGQENWGWASDRVVNILRGAPKFAWQLVVDMVRLAPSDDSLSFLPLARWRIFYPTMEST